MIVDGNRLFLDAVSSVEGFKTKLEAFLSDDNPDNLFIDEEIFRDLRVRMVSLAEFVNLSTQERFEGKTIVKVLPYELEHLRNVVFEIAPAEKEIKDFQSLPAINLYHKNSKRNIGQQAVTTYHTQQDEHLCLEKVDDISPQIHQTIRINELCRAHHAEISETEQQGILAITPDAQFPLQKFCPGPYWAENRV